MSDWQASPVLTHVYAEKADVTARFEARNDAGQTASVVVPFYVGTQPPVELNPFQQAFSPENQELTLFALGLMVTGAATIPSVARYRRRRQRLERELHAIEEVYRQTRERAAECEAALSERKAHARGLLVDGRLDQGQFHVLDDRIEELGKTLRLSTLDERFDFLPHGMVKTLREMLADGHISAWERQHFLAALERDTLLTAEYKAKVKALIEEWFARDSGQPAGPREGPT